MGKAAYKAWLSGGKGKGSGKKGADGVNAVAAPDWKDVLRSHGFQIGYVGPSEDVQKTKATEKSRSGAPWESPLMSRRTKSRARLIKEDFPCLNDAVSVNKIVSIKNNVKEKVKEKRLPRLKKLN